MGPEEVSNREERVGDVSKRDGSDAEEEDGDTEGDDVALSVGEAVVSSILKTEEMRLPTLPRWKDLFPFVVSLLRRDLELPAFVVVT